MQITRPQERPAEYMQIIRPQDRPAKYMQITRSQGCQTSTNKYIKEEDHDI